MKNTKPTDAAGSAKGASEGRRERRKRELRERIYGFTVDLFVTQGFASTTVEQIAAAADIAPATFFNHFQSKQAVLAEMTHQVVSHIQQLTDEKFQHASDTRSCLIGFADAAARDLEQARDIAREVILMIVRGDQQRSDRLPYLARVHEPFTSMLRNGQQKGDVRSDQEAEFLAEMVVGILNAPITSWLGDEHYPVEKRLRQAAVFAWEAVQSRAFAESR